MKLRAVRHGVFAGRLARLLFGDPGRWWGTHPSRELRQPAADRGRIIVNDVVDARRGGQGGNGGQGRVLDVNEGPDALSFADDRYLPPAGLVGGGTFLAVPGVRAVEESVT